MGLIDRAEGSLISAAQDADLVICCTPVQQIAETVLTVAPVISPKGMITDVGSTKQSIIDHIQREAPQIPFVGAHPLAGGTSSGYQHARADLLSGSLVILTPGQQTADHLVDRAERLWLDLDARTVRMTAAEHDVALAQTSHLPHIVAAALSSCTPRELLEITGPGWRSTTRIAAGNAHLWRQILEENRLPALRALENFAKVLTEWLHALETGDGEQLEKLLEAGKATRDALGS